MGDNTADHIDTVMEIINNYVTNNNVDPDRIYILGGSAGGYMLMRTLIAFPDFFAAAVAICPHIDLVSVTDKEILSLSEINLWLVHAENDHITPTNISSDRIHSLLPNSIYTEFANIIVDGVEYDGHWAWILAARNIPVYNDMSLWEWMASQTLAVCKGDVCNNNNSSSLRQIG